VVNGLWAHGVVFPRHAGARGAVAKHARLTGHSSLCRPHWLTRRERQKTPGERGSPFRQWSSSARHDPIGVAISNLPEGERLSAVVSNSHGKRSRCLHAHDRGLGPKANLTCGGSCGRAFYRTVSFCLRHNDWRTLRNPDCFGPRDGIPMTVRGGGFPASPLAFMPIGRMGPPLRTFAADAHDCIVVQVLGPTAYKLVARFNRA